jgi:hypothetical protein
MESSRLPTRLRPSILRNNANPKAYDPSMFAALTLERDPLNLHDIWPMVFSWLQDAGGFAAALLVLYFIVQLIQFKQFKADLKDRRNAIVFYVMAACLVVALLAYAVYGVAKAMETRASGQQASLSSSTSPAERQLAARRLQGGSLAVGGAFAIFAISLPVLIDLLRLRVRLRRVWAIARLSMKEAIRRKVLWVFSAILLVFLFGSWFFEFSAPVDQLRTYVKTLDFAMTWLLLLTAGLLAALSIPTDIKQQTIHTILTKPVERFEIVLGRFIGFTLIMTAVLLVLTLASLGYVLRGINPDAKFESLKARVPLYGALEFEGTKERNRGENVGREWDYRSYISGHHPPLPRQYAVWKFDDIPSELAKRDKVRCEYTFDIYRTTKGVDNFGVHCTFILETWQFEPQFEAQYKDELAAERKKVPPDPDIANKLAEKYGYCELPGQNVVDFHTLTLEIPGGLFKNALSDPSGRRKQLKAQGLNPPLVTLKVQCDDPTQYVGVAKRDLYFRVDDPDSQWDTLWFAWNYFKGSFGLWLRLCLAIGLCVTFSTYLSWVIAFLLAAILYLGGYFQNYIQSLASPTQNDGGGFAESFIRLVKRENSVTPLEDTTQTVVNLWDEPFRWFLRRVLNILPDVDRFDLSNFVAEGFNISGTDLLVNSLLLVGFLLPLAILAYYLIRWREVASAT